MSRFFWLICGTFYLASATVIPPKVSNDIKKSGNPASPDSMGCTICTDAVNYVQENPFDPYSTVFSVMKTECRTYAQYYNSCINVLNNYLPSIYDDAHHLWEDVNQICIDDLHLCNVSSSLIIPKIDQKSGVGCGDLCTASISCTICKDSVNYVKNNPGCSYNQVYRAMKQECSSFDSYKTQCVSVLDVYLPFIYEDAKHPWETVDSICAEYDLCNYKKA